MRRVTVLLLFSLFFAGFSMAVGGVKKYKDRCTDLGYCKKL